MMEKKKGDRLLFYTVYKIRKGKKVVCPLFSSPNKIKFKKFSIKRRNIKIYVVGKIKRTFNKLIYSGKK
jgi:hypothetical protein